VIGWHDFLFDVKEDNTQVIALVLPGGGPQPDLRVKNRQPFNSVIRLEPTSLSFLVFMIAAETKLQDCGVPNAIFGIAPAQPVGLHAAPCGSAPAGNIKKSALTDYYGYNLFDYSIK
jgi:hypothetical protein